MLVTHGFGHSIHFQSVSIWPRFERNPTLSTYKRCEKKRNYSVKEDEVNFSLTNKNVLKEGRTCFTIVFCYD